MVNTFPNPFLVRPVSFVIGVTDFLSLFTTYSLLIFPVTWTPYYPFPFSPFSNLSVPVLVYTITTVSWFKSKCPSKISPVRLSGVTNRHRCTSHLFISTPVRNPIYLSTIFLTIEVPLISFIRSSISIPVLSNWIKTMACFLELDKRNDMRYS